ncbi:MAG: sulfate/molybdate ABC transporter ATP-binding protein [Burkholderiales bacterium]
MIWDVDLQRVLVHEGSRFELGVRFASEAPRLVLYGPSGAGKTHTLKMIAGIARPDSGRIVVAGRTLFDSAAGVRLSPQARRLACVFQDYALFPHLSVRQNIAFACRSGWLNPPTKAHDERAERWIAAFHLESVAGHLPHQISGGQRQRTALARALVNDPTALLLDEPFAALDNALRQRLRDELKDLQAQLKLPMLLITHDDDDVRLLADQVVHLRAGKVVDGTAVQEAALVG